MKNEDLTRICPTCISSKTPSEIIDVVAKVFGVDRQAIVKRGSRQVPERTVLL